jgi:hypothetical protein
VIQVGDIVRHLIHGTEGVVVANDGFIATVEFSSGRGHYAAQFGVIRKIGRVTKWKTKER